MFSAGFFGENLKQLRKSRGFTQAQLAQRLFLSTQAISKWERGESVPDLCHIYSLTQILNVTADMLLGIRADGQTALLAVDGGGTKTEFVLITPEGRLLQRLVLAGSNPNNGSIEQSFRVLCQGIDRMLQGSYRILGIFVGCAGMASGNNAAAMTELLKKQYPGIPLDCRSDICNVLACARDPENAIAVICGTGSVVYATRQGKLIRAGGGGWKLDALGSGYELGRQALLAALEHRDGTGPATALTEAVERQLGSTVWSSISSVYAAQPAKIAAFAPCVLDAWQRGDGIAGRIVDDNCKRLAQLIRCSCEKSPLAKEVLLTGSVLEKSQPFRQHLIDMLPDSLQVYVFQQPQVWGACVQCAGLCKLPKPDVQQFLSDYQLEVAQC